MAIIWKTFGEWKVGYINYFNGEKYVIETFKDKEAAIKYMLFLNHGI